MSNIFEEMLRRGEKGRVLTTQEFLQGVTEPSRPQLVKRTNPITNVLEKKFTQGQDDEPLVLSPEERAARSEFKYGGTIAQQLSQQEVAKKAVADKLAETLKTEAPKKAAAAAKDSAGSGKGVSAGLNFASGMAGGSGTIAGGALGGAGTGFAIGGPVGAGIGAIAGGIAGGLGAKAKRKKEKREAEAAAQRNIANIALETGRNRNVGISNIMQALQSALTRR